MYILGAFLVYAVKLNIILKLKILSFQCLTYYMQIINCLDNTKYIDRLKIWYFITYDI